MPPVTLDHLDASTPMGASLVADGATFRVWAPNAHEVHVLGEFGAWSPVAETRLIRIDGGHWWGFVRGAKDRQAYKFWVVGDSGGGWKRDPHARELDWSLSGILCVRHSMTRRSMYAKQDQSEERGHSRQVGRVAQDPQGTA